MITVYYNVRTSDGYACVDYFASLEAAELYEEQNEGQYGNDGEGSFECSNFSERLTTLDDVKREYKLGVYSDVVCPVCGSNQLSMHTPAGYYCWDCKSKSDEDPEGI